MLTRLQKKLQQQAPVNKIPEESKQEERGNHSQPVRLNDDILFMVNKKLMMMDKAARDKQINTFTKQPHPSCRPFTEVVYRKTGPRDLSQAQQAVMHKAQFNSTSTLVTDYKCMGYFWPQVYQASRFAVCPDYKSFLTFHKRDADAKLENPVARFVQLPSTYFEPYLGLCPFFAELAWNEKDAIIVEADKFALCMTIWTLKRWLMMPAAFDYLLACGTAGKLECRCRNLIRAMSTDENLRKFFQDKTSLLQTKSSVELHRQKIALEDAAYQMKEYAIKLVTGEEIISGLGRSENAVSSLLLTRLAEKVDDMVKCVEEKMGWNGHPVIRIDCGGGFSDSDDGSDDDFY